ncbi:MAG: ATP-binding protein [Chloroflexi bacterium]|nr:ATP-binding protein [Chloroflexota bacterium]
MTMSPSLPLPHSLRARLTLWHVLVLGIVLVSFTLAVYGLLIRNLSDELDRSLVDRARQVNSALPPPQPQRPGRPFPPQGVIIPRPDRFASADTFVQVAALDGEVVATSENLGAVNLPVSDDDRAAARERAGRFAFADLQAGRVRVYSAPLIVQGQPVGIIQVARSLDFLDHALDQLRLLAGLGVAVALVISGVGVWLTSGAALRPVEQVIHTAEAIGSSGDLARRVPPSFSTDEAGRLANTFNRMLDRLETSASALQSAYARVEGALEAQRRFAADASHELRTPLTSIRNNAGLLVQYPDVTLEDRTAALVQINQEAERMSRLVQDLLTLARADAGQPMPQATVALAPLVEDVAAQARLLSRGQHVISTEISRPSDVTGNPDALRQLVLLLLDNAVKYTPAGGRINVRLGSQNGTVGLSVSDTGIGIAPEDLPHIFERFYRADRARKAGGTGLGLAIARWIVEQHHGSIQAESIPGEGSSFTVRLPLTSIAPAVPTP